MIINKAITAELQAAEMNERTIVEQVALEWYLSDVEITSKYEGEDANHRYGISVSFVGHGGLSTGFRIPTKEIYDSLSEGQIVQAIGNTPNPGLGGMSNGFSIDGQIVGFKTRLEQLAEDLTSIAATDRRERDEWDQKGFEYVRQIDALPKLLRGLVHGWLDTCPKFKFHIAYELAALQLAAKIIDYANERQWTEDQLVEWFRGDKYHGWVNDNDTSGGFSGNQVMYAGMIARTAINDPSKVVPWKAGEGGIPPGISALIGWPMERKYTDA